MESLSQIKCVTVFCSKSRLQQTVCVTPEISALFSQQSLKTACMFWKHKHCNRSVISECYRVSVPSSFKIKCISNMSRHVTSVLSCEVLLNIVLFLAKPLSFD